MKSAWVLDSTGAVPEWEISGLTDIPFDPTAHQGFRRASPSSRPAQNRKLSNSHLDSHIKPNTSRALNVSAGFPEYVSTRQRKNSLRQGVSRCPRVAFQTNRIAPNKSRLPLPSVTSSEYLAFGERRRGIYLQSSRVITEACRTNFPTQAGRSRPRVPSPASWIATVASQR